MIPLLLLYTLFPYTTLFRSLRRLSGTPARARHGLRRGDRAAPSPVRPRYAGRAEDRGVRDADQPRYPLRQGQASLQGPPRPVVLDRKSTRLNSSHVSISYAV